MKPKYQILIQKIQQFFEQQHLSKVVIGLSGGIDSALSAMLHVSALGKEQVLLVNLPTKYNSQTTQKLAKQIATNLGCQYLVVPLDELLQQTKITLKKAQAQIKWPVVNQTDENIQARLRGATILAGLCGDYGAVFPCNGNKNEFEVGYATILGDLAGYGCPLGDLWKSEVYEQARLLSEELGGILPEEIFTLPASAELSLAQNPELGGGDQMVDSYHEQLFKNWQKVSPAEIVAAYQEKKLEQLLQMTKETAVKVYQKWPTQERFAADLNYWWQLKKQNKFKKKLAPPIFLAE